MVEFVPRLSVSVMARAIAVASAVATEGVRIVAAATSIPLLLAIAVHVRDPLKVVPQGQASVEYTCGGCEASTHELGDAHCGRLGAFDAICERIVEGVILYYHHSIAGREENQTWPVYSPSLWCGV
ncbi:hypothetical protein MRX96_022383 [Rhipicephalus microplus]